MNKVDTACKGTYTLQMDFHHCFCNFLFTKYQFLLFDFTVVR